MEWDNIPLDEQETIVHIDYFERTMCIYTSRKSVATRLKRRCGTPDHEYTNYGKIYAVEYKRSLYDKDIAKFFSKTILAGQLKDTTNCEETKEETE